ncbi:hypothetical protein Bca4012_085408 [Brassica carinata]
MEKKREICEYRERLDKTLSSPDLTSDQTLKTLIRQQLNQECTVDVLDQRVSDLSSILEKLRSASTKDQDLSQSTNEATSHGDWKVKHDHEDCRVMYREGLEGSPFHTLLVEGYMDGPIQDLENFGKNGVYEAADAVRVDLVGGVAIQKVSSERSYLRYISEIDIKLDLVPPSLINLVSRQLLGNGFKLFKKTIGSVAKSDDYSTVLADPLYTMIRQALYSTDEFHSQERRHCEEKERHSKTEPSLCKRDVHEIEEEECDDDGDENKSVSSSSSSEQEDESYIGRTYNGKTLFCISPEVKQALGTLEKVITMVRKSRTDYNNKTSSTFLEEQEEEEEASSSPKLHVERTEIVSSSKVCFQDPNTELLDEASLTHYHHNTNNNRRSGSSSFAREGNKIAPASPEIIDPTTTPEVTRITVSQATTLFSQTDENSNDKPSGLNGGKSSVLQRKRKPRCFGIRSWMRKT